MKKGQVAIYILIGLVLLIAIQFAFFLHNASTDVSQETVTVSLEFTSLERVVESCAEEISMEALRTIGINGGFFTEGKVHYSDGMSQVPSDQFVESNLEMYVNEAMAYCAIVANESEPGIQAVEKATKTKVTINPKSVQFEIVPGIEFSKQDSVHMQRFIKFSIDVPLQDMLDLSRKMAERQPEFGNLICVDCLSDYAKEDNFTIEYASDGDVVYYTILTEDPEYMFMTTHDLSE